LLKVKFTNKLFECPQISVGKLIFDVPVQPLVQDKEDMFREFVPGMLERRVFVTYGKLQVVGKKRSYLDRWETVEKGLR
jgi:hypothetical protein